MTAISTRHGISSPLTVPPIGGPRAVYERPNAVQDKSVSLSGVNVDAGTRNPTISFNENRSLAREPYRIRIDAQNNGFSSERERLILMRTVSHLRKDEKSPTKQKSIAEAQRSIQEDHDEHSVRPFHHSELASPPCYSNTRSGFSRLSLDIRRSRAMSASDSSPYGEMPRSKNSASNERRWFSRSQLDLSNPSGPSHDSDNSSPTSPRFPSQTTRSDGISNAKARFTALTSTKLRRLSFANLPKLNSKKSEMISMNKDSHSTNWIKKEKQRAIPTAELQGTDVNIENTFAEREGIQISTNDANSDDSVSGLQSMSLEEENGIVSASSIGNTFRRSSDAPSSFTFTEPSTNSEDGNISLQNSLNSSRRNSDFRLSNGQSTAANTTNSAAIESLSQSTTTCEMDEEDDGIRWATPSESIHTSVNPFDKRQALMNADTHPSAAKFSTASSASPLQNINRSSSPSSFGPSKNDSQRDHNATEVTLQKSKNKGEMSTTQFISPFTSILDSKNQMKSINAIGLDEEQAHLERAKEEIDSEGGSRNSSNESIPALPTNQEINNMYSTQSSQQQSQQQDSTNNNAARRTRSSRLSQLPRLNSARGKQGFGSGSGGRNGEAGGGLGGAAGSGGDGGDDRRDSNASQISEDPPSDDETIEGQEDGETETDTDSEGSLASDDDDLSGMPGSLPAPISHDHDMSRGMSTGSRGRRPSGITMPPAPTFAHLEPFSTRATGQSHLEGVGKTHGGLGPTDTEISEELIEGINTPKIGKRSGYENESLNTAFTERTPSMSVAPIQNRESWTQFGEETPGWLPTPKASAPIGSSAQTPKTNLSLQTQSKNGQASPTDASYFNIQPAPSNNVIRNRNDSNNPNSQIPPPSPSIITRSRAQSSASFRSIGMSPGISSRELPPMPPIVPLNLRSADRARSPNRKLASSLAIQAIESSPSTSIDESSIDSTNEAAKSAFSASQQKQTSSRTTTPRPATASSAAVPAPELNVSASSPSSPRNSELSIHSSLGRQKGTALLGASVLGSTRPGLYSQESRSLIDLSSPARSQMEPTLKPLQKPLAVKEVHPTQLDQVKQAEQQARVASPAPSIESINASTSASASTSNLRRRNSMYEVGAAPPPYTIIPGGSQTVEAKIVPREEEGKELLPNYHCSVHIEGYLPRKMEFSSPGVQAKDRSWKRQYFVLHGTSLRIYRNDMSGDRSAMKGEHGVMSGVHVHFEPMNEDGPNQPTGNTTSRVVAADGNANVTSKDQVTSSANASSPTNGQNHTANRSPTASTINSKTSDGHSGNGALSRKVEALQGTLSHSLHRGTLVKQYTLQGAESGLAADYLKRRHVVRVRTEGEQFLLQTRNDRHVVDWIEAFQAATNIAMDLERRQMPKFITLPRRRRRRNNGQRGARELSGTNGQSGTGNGESEQGTAMIPDENLSAREMADLAEARRRSLMESNASASTRSSISGQSRANPPRPLGLPGDESPNPSAAFERMLREEEEAMSRQDAGDI